jgi:carbon starvation protein
VAYGLAAGICIGSVFLGIAYPVTLAPTTWMVVISIYVLIAAGVPVWLILQPRDFINVQILYGGIGLMVVSLFSCGFQGIRITMPRFNLAEGTLNLGFIWPMMFITIACGAISGFHCLVAGGTTGKQLAKEPDARRVGYNAMLLESLLSVCVLLALGAVMTFSDYKAIVWPTDPAVRSNPILGFSLAAGRLFHQGLGIPVALGTVFGILLVEGFVITTLDAAVRLNRYLFEELWSIVLKKVPGLLRQYWFNSGLSVVLMWTLAYSNAFSALWPIFGTANQLLAAMALLTVSAWLLLRKRRNWFTLVPAVFMVATTLSAGLPQNIGRAFILSLRPSSWPCRPASSSSPKTFLKKGGPDGAGGVKGTYGRKRVSSCGGGPGTWRPCAQPSSRSASRSSSRTASAGPASTTAASRQSISFTRRRSSKRSEGRRRSRGPSARSA